MPATLEAARVHARRRSEMASAGAVVLFGLRAKSTPWARSASTDLRPARRPLQPAGRADQGLQPNVLDMGAGRLFSLEELSGLAHACISRDESLIRARRLGEGEHVLVFSRWEPRRSFAGVPASGLPATGRATSPSSAGTSSAEATARPDLSADPCREQKGGIRPAEGNGPLRQGRRENLRGGRGCGIRPPAAPAWRRF